jgi:hypothetical protein
LRGIGFLLVTLVLALANAPWCARADNRAQYRTLFSAEEIALADQCFEALRKHDLAAVAAKLDPSLRNADTMARLEKMASLVPPQDPVSSDIFQGTVTTTNGVRSTRLTFQYLFPKVWLVADFTEGKVGKELLVGNFKVQLMSRSLWELNEISPQALTFKPAATLLVAGAAIVVPTFILVTAVICLLTPIPWRRKWFWLLFILIGVTELSVDWMTGETSFHLFYFLLLGASLLKGGAYGGWVFSMSLPLGAMIFWVKRPGWVEDHARLMEQVELEMRKEDL